MTPPRRKLAAVDRMVSASAILIARLAKALLGRAEMAHDLGYSIINPYPHSAWSFHLCEHDSCKEARDLAREAGVLED